MTKRETLRLLMVADVSPLQRSGGSARVIREQTLGLLRQGHTVSLLCRHPGGDIPMEADIGGAPILHYPVSRANPLAYATTSLFGARRSFKRHFETADWDCVLFHQPFSAVGVQSVLPRRQPCLYCFYSPAGREYTLRAACPETGQSPWFTGIASTVLARIERRALRRATNVVVLSEFSRRILEKNHGEPSPQIAILPGGVDLEHFRPSTDRMAVRDELHLPRDVPLLVTIRDLEQRMGIETLLAALANFDETQRPFCVIGGSGPLRSFLEERASRLGVNDRVRFAGHIPEKELPLYYQAADLFVLPTRSHEGFGLVTVEALACGTPVVATPAGATPEILAPLDNRLLTEDTGAEAIASAIERSIRLAENDSFRRRCRAYAEERYSWEKHIDALEKELYRFRRLSSDRTT